MRRSVTRAPGTFCMRIIVLNRSVLFGRLYGVVYFHQGLAGGSAGADMGAGLSGASVALLAGAFQAPGGRDARGLRQ